MMKKFISVVAVLAMLVTMAFSVAAVTASAEADIDLIPSAKANDSTQSDGRAGSYKYDGDTLVLTATGAKGYGVTFALDATVDPTVMAYINTSIEATAQFNIAMNVSTKTGSGWPQAIQDWFDSFGLGQAPAEGSGIPKGTYDKVSMNFGGYFTWNSNEKMPADGKTKIMTLSIAAMEPGTVTIKGMKLSATQTNGSVTTTKAGDTTTTAKATTTTAKAVTTTASNAKTGEDTTVLVMMTIAMVLAGAVLVVALNAKKLRQR